MKTAGRTSPRFHPIAAARVRGLLCLALGMALVGCYDRKQTGVLNPDGSGKMVIDTEFAASTVSVPGQTKLDVLTVAREFASNLMTSTVGVDAWSGLSVEETPDGLARVVATAYFPDVSKLKFDLPIVAQWKKQDNGDYQFSIGRPHPATAPAAPKPSDEDLKKQVAGAQADYKETQLAMQTGLNAFRLTITYTLPGTIKDSHILTVSDPHTVSIVLDGKKIAPVLDKFMSDDKVLAASLAAGSNATDNEDYLLEALYGKKGPATASVTGVTDKPAFDYKSEVIAAQLRESAMLKDAGVELAKLRIRAAGTAPGK